MIRRHDNHQALLQSSMFSKPWNEQVTQSSEGRAADEEDALCAVAQSMQENISVGGWIGI